jgi:hypothetical protein
MRLVQLASVSTLVLGAALGAACGGTTQNANATNDAGGSDTGIAPDVTTMAPPDSGTAPTPDAAPPVYPYPAKDPADPPQVVTLGGPVMKAPKIVPVFFANDPDTATLAKVADFVKKVGQTQYWKANTTEYGVGAATGLDPIMLTAADNPPATLDDSTIQTWLAGKLNSNDPAWPKPDQNTIYAMFYPAATTITLGGGMAPTGDAGAPPDAGGFGGGVETSCQYFGGYHQDILLDANHGTANVAYAVLPRCPAFNGLSAQDGLTSAASHEFLEASTDPFPIEDPAYAQVDNPHFYWSSFLGGGEIGDMCAQFLPSFTKFAEMPDYEVQRSWSNKAASTGQDPCVPALPGEVYFNTVPVMDKVPASYAGQTVTASGVQIAAGQSKTIELDLFSTGPTSGPWTVSAADQATLRMQPAQLNFTFDKTTGQNGDKIMMTIQVVTASKRNRESFVITSTLGSVNNVWIGTVVN